MADAVTPGPDTGGPAAGVEAGLPAGRRPRKPLRGTPLAVVLLLLGVIATAVSAGLTWGRAEYLDSLSGIVSTSASGSQMRPELVPLALAALAGLGAALATRGIARRIVGAGIAAAGALVAVRAVLALFSPPLETLGNLSRPAVPTGPAVTPVWPPLLAVVGGSLLLAAGVVLIIARSGRGLGSRFERSSGRRPAPAEPGFAAEVAATDLWNSLSADTDPTADTAPVANRPPAER